MLKFIRPFFAPSVSKRSHLPWYLRLTPRLTILIFVITVPLLVAVTTFVISNAGSLMVGQSNQILQNNAEKVQSTLAIWLDLQDQALTELTSLTDISSMDPERQKPILQAMDAAYPNLFLVHALNLQGVDIARSDSTKLTDYHDRLWFTGALSGAPVTYDVTISRTIGKPVLSISQPIKDASGQIVGVAGIVSQLDFITNAVGASAISKNGYIYVVDAQNLTVAHPNPAYTNGDKLQNLSSYPPVAAMRHGVKGLMDFTDENGEQWRAYIILMNNNWGVIAQEPVTELLAPLHLFQGVSVLLLTIGILLLLIFAWLTISRTLHPIGTLTETVEAITSGDINRTAMVTSKNEVGILASAFNSMTAQLRDLISTLETRVVDRTKELEQRTTELEDISGRMKKRADQLQAMAQVGRAVTSLQNLDQLLPYVTRVICEKFGFYHIGIFLIDKEKEYAVLTAANSEGGERMLERGHKLQVGEVGIVGYVASSGRPRIALDTDADVVFFTNPDLPNTHSEIALPLSVGSEIIGVLDVQSEKSSAFGDEDLELLTILADQVSIAIQNARRFEETQKAIANAEMISRQYIRQEWQSTDEEETIGYRFSEAGVRPITRLTEAIGASQTDSAEKQSNNSMVIPIKLRGQTIGTLRLRPNEERNWDQDMVDISQAVADRVALALENARLLESSQNQATKERVIGEISTKISAATNMDNILKTAIGELGSIIPDTDIFIQFTPEQGS
jgi:GAF domain-containing protein/HAMP domain-containing protein